VLDHAHRHVKRQRIAGAGAVPIRRDDEHLVTGFTQPAARIRMPGASTPSSLLTSTRMNALQCLAG
jgi:hypothetical protein